MSKNIINVWHDSEMNWLDYTLEEINKYFHFVTKPDFTKIREIYLHNSGFETWMEVVFNNGNSSSYNKVYGTYVEVGA